MACLEDHCWLQTTELALRKLMNVQSVTMQDYAHCCNSQDCIVKLQQGELACRVKSVVLHTSIIWCVLNIEDEHH